MLHRVMYSLFIGPIPEKLILDHICETRSCCNPFHLEPKTIRDNTHRGQAVLFGYGV